MLKTSVIRAIRYFAVLALIGVSIDTVQASLVAKYEFEGNLNDSSGNGHTGDFLGLAAIINDPVRGNVLDVPEDTDGVDIHFNNPIPAFPAQTSITLAAWVKRSGIQNGSNNQYAVNLGENGDAPIATLGVRANEDTVTGFIETDQIGGNLDQVEVRGTTAIEAGLDAWVDWHHIAVVYDRSTDIGRTYLDGVQDSAVDISLLDDTEDQTWFSATIGTNGAFGSSLSSRIDDVYIYDEARTAGQIADLVGVAALVLDVDRGTGNLQLTNVSSTLPIGIRGYSITSSFGSLDSDEPPWTPISGNYDELANGGNGSVDIDDPWTVLTGAGVHTDLSEAELSGGDGGVIMAGQTVDLGNVWFKSPTEDLVLEVTLADGTVRNYGVNFSGGPLGVPFVRSDLDFDGAVDADDWPILRDNNLADLSGLSLAEAYARGDLDGSGTNDISDFSLFKTDYDAVFGVGALEALIAQVPEPSSLALLAGCLCGVSTCRNRRFRQLPKAVCLIAVVGMPLLIAPTEATAQSVDFSTFTVQNYPPAFDKTSFFAPPVYDTTTPTTALLTASAGWHVFYGADSILNKRITGTINPGGDDDIVGLVLGYSPGDVSDNPTAGQFNPSADFLLLDWKKVTQNFDFTDDPPAAMGGFNFHDLTTGQQPMPAGLALSRVTGLPNGDELWQHINAGANSSGAVTELARGATLGSTGYATSTDVTFDITYTSTNINVRVDGVQQFNVNGTFPDGALGLYSLGQSPNQGAAAPLVYSNFQLSSLADVLAATVDLSSGDVTISNDTSSPIELDYYQLSSVGGSLDPVGWDSLQDQDLSSPSFPAGDGTGNGWEESGGSNPAALAEGFLTGSSTLGSGESFVLADAYDVLVDAQDILLSYRGPDGIVTGDVVAQYVGSPADADFDGDNDRDGADFLTWQRGFGLTGQIDNSNGDATGNGTVGGEDLAAWEQQFGSVVPPLSAAQAVPEPSTAVLALLIVGSLGVLTNRNTRSPGACWIGKYVGSRKADAARGLAVDVGSNGRTTGWKRGSI